MFFPGEKPVTNAGWPNEEVRSRVRAAIGPHDDLFSIVKKRKLRWYGHVTRPRRPAKTIMQGTVPAGGDEAGQRNAGMIASTNGRSCLPPRPLRLAEDKDGWRKFIRTSVVPLQPHLPTHTHTPTTAKGRRR